MSKEKDKFYRTNGQIRISPIVVIDERGSNMGSIPTYRAIEMASEAGLDLVEISPSSRPPVCRIMDFGKFKFEQAVKERAQRKKQNKLTQTKEIQLSPSIQKHDMETKSKAARKFLEAGQKVNIRLEFRRRELAHRDIGDRVMSEFIQTLSDIGEPIGRPKSEGKALFCVIEPKQDSQK